jgi:hypothetical protein
MGQHPQRFKCAALRNPVLNIALMVGVTDIPDWCYIETYGTQVRNTTTVLRIMAGSTLQGKGCVCSAGGPGLCIGTYGTQAPQSG